MCSCFLFFYWDWCLDWEVTLCATLEFVPLGVAKGVCPSATRNGDPGELPGNRNEFAETNPPWFYGKSDWNRGNKSSGVLWQIQFNWPTSELGQGGSGAETFLECSHKKCLKRGKQRNVDRGHTSGTLNKWTKMFLHLEGKSTSFFNHLISIGTQRGLVFMDKTLDFLNLSYLLIHYHKHACLL